MRDDLETYRAQSAPLERERSEVAAQATTRLRILATTDVHMQLLGHDYVRDQPLDHHGLAGLAGLIKTARAEAQAHGAACVLVDNGDMLQGTALGDALAAMPVTPTHPIVAMIDAMGYDAIGVGNHDLDHGLIYLQRIAGLSRAPFICSNLVLNQECALQTSALIERDSITESGAAASVSLNIGIASVLPKLTGIWNKPMLEGQAHILPAQDILAQTIPDLRTQGADIVIVLAHMGIDDRKAHEDARALAAVPGVDAMITGHTHLRLPGQDHEGLRNVDSAKGAVGHCPTAMPGFGASDLAVLDLKLSCDGNGAWQVTDHTVELRPNTPDVPPAPEILEICAPVHLKTCDNLAESVGRSEQPLQNFFSLAVPTTTSALIASAKRRVIAEQLRGTPEAQLPLLASASADTAGGRGGPDHFLNIPAGLLHRRALSGLNPYNNTISALRLTGADLRAWLEHTAGIYTHLQRSKLAQDLLRADWPAFHYDTIYGLEYGIDPSQPEGRRITFIRNEGREMRDTQAFILATNQFRAAGGGGGAIFGPSKTFCHTEVKVSEALNDTLRSGQWDFPAGTQPWAFDCAKPIQAILRTSAQAKDHLHDIAHLVPECLPLDAQGFMPIRLTL